MILPQQQIPAVVTPFSCVLFDMDGTLLDSAAGVTASAAKALAAVGARVPSPEELRRFVGPPMLESFSGPAGLDEETAQKALKHYRQAYADEGAGQSALYEGIPEMLERLNDAGVPMAIATSKVEDQAIRLARHFGLEHHFVSICGASDRERRATKADVIAELLLRLARAGVDLSHPVMVGDRSYDVDGAASHGIPTIFAAWGYGSATEASAAAFVSSSPLAVLETVLPGSVQPAPI
jgi:phosphoglycolate phosphatase